MPTDLATLLGAECTFVIPLQLRRWVNDTFPKPSVDPVSYIVGVKFKFTVKTKQFD